MVFSWDLFMSILIPQYHALCMLQMFPCTCHKLLLVHTCIVESLHAFLHRQHGFQALAVGAKIPCRVSTSSSTFMRVP